MPVTTSGSVPAVNNLADELARQLSTSGNAARAAVGDRAVAFDWTAGIRPWAGSVFTSTLTTGLQYRSTLVSLTATPPVKVAKSAPKPVAVQMTTAVNQLPKYAGIGEMTTEDVLDTDALVGAVYTVLIDGCLQAFSADIGAVLTAGAGQTATGADWAEAILNGVSVLPNADVLCLAAADYAAAVKPGTGFALDPTNAVPVLFGLQVVIVPGLVAGTGFVCNSNAVLVAESMLSPSVVCDPFSKSDTNTTRLIVDLFAQAQVTAPYGVVAVTVAPV
jgi:hypothetical protein